MRRPTAIVIALSVVLVALLAQGCGQSGDSSPGNTQGGDRQEDEKRFDTEQEAATDALETFALLVSKDNREAMGFTSEDEVKSASLGEPIAVRMVRLDQLKTFQPGSDPNPLLHDTRQVIYPVLVRDEVRSSIMLVQAAPGEWQAVSFGNPRLARQIAQTRRSIAAMSQSVPASQPSPDAAQSPAPQTAPATTATPTPTPVAAATQSTPLPAVAAPAVVVHVAALNLRFIGHLSGGEWMLTPLENAPDYGLEAGRTARARDVFAALASNEIVRKYNGLPM